VDNLFYVPDFICYDSIIVELKALAATTGAHRAACPRKTRKLRKRNKYPVQYQQDARQMGVLLKYSG
jgi:hypothetical protein